MTDCTAEAQGFTGRAVAQFPSAPGAATGCTILGGYIAVEFNNLGRFRGGLRSQSVSLD